MSARGPFTPGPRQPWSGGASGGAAKRDVFADLDDQDDAFGCGGNGVAAQRADLVRLTLRCVVNQAIGRLRRPTSVALGGRDNDIDLDISRRAEALTWRSSYGPRRTNRCLRGRPTGRRPP